MLKGHHHATVPKRAEYGSSKWNSIHSLDGAAAAPVTDARQQEARTYIGEVSSARADSMMSEIFSSSPPVCMTLQKPVPEDRSGIDVNSLHFSRLDILAQPIIPASVSKETGLRQCFAYLQAAILAPPLLPRVPSSL
jgi:hypothetical protein